MFKFSVLAIFLVVLAVACNKKEETTQAPAEAAPAVEVVPAEAAPAVEAAPEAAPEAAAQ